MGNKSDSAISRREFARARSVCFRRCISGTVKNFSAGVYRRTAAGAAARERA